MSFSLYKYIFVIKAESKHVNKYCELDVIQHWETKRNKCYKRTVVDLRMRTSIFNTMQQRKTVSLEQDPWNVWKKAETSNENENCARSIERQCESFTEACSTMAYPISTVTTLHKADYSVPIIILDVCNWRVLKSDQGIPCCIQTLSWIPIVSYLLQSRRYEEDRGGKFQNKLAGRVTRKTEYGQNRHETPPSDASPFYKVGLYCWDCPNKSWFSCNLATRCWTMYCITFSYYLESNVSVKG